ncbi:hypothetical protein [Erythrobacter dokdonensis]|uniref:Uncharacterized protein n=1 Tax=Erythrobacter dokdonensis DSW-74 TaxID=1300349 RepID=A0A1A7BDH7_9SPHN|nr:hypothetical protein [Erythrobacter dokdonensis]OBV10583.1 hypothetical protein I603_1796 [Erythrobacter dokdonensis DSW-74]
MKTKILATAAALVCLSAPAFAATQGTPGPTSTGTVTINASITPEVNITNLDDITFAATSLRTALNTGANANQSDDICIWSNNPDGSFFVTATGDGAANAFTITDGTRTTPYSIVIRDFAGTSQTLTAGTKSAQYRSNAVAPDCGGSTNTTLTVQITSTAIAAMEATTTYTGVLTLLVSPT